MDIIGQTLSRPNAEGAADREAIRHALASVRAHMGMEVAYISEFVGDQSVFREVDAPGLEDKIKPGDSRALDDVYCRHILEGRLPELIPDTSQNDFAMGLPITANEHIGAHASVPIRLEDGSVYGMFCCLSFEPDQSLNQRDLQMMRVFADMTARQLSTEAQAKRVDQDKRARILGAIHNREITTVFQPIWDLLQGRPIGFESLSRFSAEPYRSPDKWFNEAAEVGEALALECAAIRIALEAAAAFPEDLYLSVNASPEVILSGALVEIVAPYAGKRIVLEVTEHAPVADYAALEASLAPLRAAGVLLAIDDAGAGYASLQHIVQLKPDIIKLDIGLTRAVDSDPARRALVSALIFFARETGCFIIAEGIETESELSVLRLLGVSKGQGYLLGRPVPLDRALAIVAASPEVVLRRAS